MDFSRSVDALERQFVIFVIVNSMLLNNKFLMSVLHVAEKNSIAKEVANILSHSSKRSIPTLSKYNPIFEF